MRGWTIAAQVAMQVCLGALWVPAIAGEPQDLIEVGGVQPTVVEIDGREFLRYQLRGDTEGGQRGIENTALELWIWEQVKSAMDAGPRAKAPDNVQVDFQFVSQARKTLISQDRHSGRVVVAPLDQRALIFRGRDVDADQIPSGFSLPAFVAKVDLLVPVHGGAALIFAMGSGTEPRLAAGESGRLNQVQTEVYGYTTVRLELPNQLWLFGQFTMNNLLENDGNEAVLGFLFQF